jgi:Lrp/AsnC family transcriptional regulator, regulator for asnA, asnC and gidA
MLKKLDTVDAKIIELLKDDGRMPNTEIAKLSGVSEATVRNRLQRLTKNGTISIVAVGDPKKLGFNISANIIIRSQSTKIESITRQLEQIPEIWYLANMTGFADFNLEINVHTLEDLDTLLEKINSIDGVDQTYTSVIRKYIRDQYIWWTIDK